MSPDSEDGDVQHIENIHAAEASTAPSAATDNATGTGSTPQTTPQQPIPNTPHRVPVLNTVLLPHPSRPSDRARLLRNEAAAAAAAAAAACHRPMIVRLQDVHAVGLLVHPEMQRPQLRSRDSGYEADESSSDSGGEGDGVNSDSSEDVHVGEREGEQGGRRGGVIGRLSCGDVQTVRRRQDMARVEGVRSSATVE